MLRLLTLTVVYGQSATDSRGRLSIRNYCLEKSGRPLASSYGVDSLIGQSRTPVPTELLFGTKRTTIGKSLRGGFVNRTVEDACPYGIIVWKKADDQ